MSERKHAPRDPFRMLAIIGIVLGLVIVAAAMIFWFVTGRESSLFVGAGLTLSIGGGLRNMVAGIAEKFPDYERVREPTDKPAKPGRSAR